MPNFRFGIILYFIFANYSFASESESWINEVKSLSSSVQDSAAKYQVVSDLVKWDPNESNMPMMLISSFRDAYLHDEAFRSTVRANFMPSFMQFCYELVCPNNVNVIEVDILFRASTIGYEILRNAHKLPYIFFSGSDGAYSNPYSWNDLAVSGSTIMSHGFAIFGDLCKMTNVTGDPIERVIVEAISQISYGNSYLFSAVAAYFAMSSDYIDVALRSQKRLYEMQHKNKELAVVLQMIALRTQN